MRTLMKYAIAVGVFGLALGQTPVSAQTGFRSIVDHIHLAAPDQVKGVEWYFEHFDGVKMPEGPDRLLFGDTRLLFQKREPKPSAGSVFDHIAFAVADVDASMRHFQEMGVKIVERPRDVSGFFRTAMIEDPWGTRVELVQDGSRTRLHHVHLQGPDPAATLAWYADKLGQKVTKLKGQDSIELTGVWLLAQRGAAMPSEGHSIDHIGFRPLNVDNAVVALKAKNVVVTTEPRPLTLPSGTSMRLAFITGPDGARIELVQRQ
jgi:catechol 2,3-dioxygenase-like lactoylglutathione lyase family enzyme